MKEEIKFITFSDEPKVIAQPGKIDYCELLETVKVNINTTKHNLLFYIYKGYSWKSKISRYFLSKNNKISKLNIVNKIINTIMLYKYITEFKVYIINEIMKDKISILKYFYFVFKIIIWLLKEE